MLENSAGVCLDVDTLDENQLRQAIDDLANTDLANNKERIEKLEIIKTLAQENMKYVEELIGDSIK